MFRLLALPFFAVLATLTFIVPATAQFSMPGQVIDVIDGKTVLVALPSGRVKVELQYIDVPDQGEELYDIVKDHLSKLVIGKSVEYLPKTMLPDRTIGRLVVNTVDVSRQMLRDGAAWHLPMKESGQNKTEYDLYASTESAAKSDKLGVWSITGLKPVWEVRSANTQRVRHQEQTAAAVTRSYEAEPPPKPKPALRTGSNPAFGNVGALANGYDAKTRTGYLGTSFLDVAEVDRALAAEQRTAIDITYFYKEDDHNVRTGFYVVSLISIAKKLRFLDHNDLILVSNGKNIVIGKPRRTTSNEGDTVREKLTYEVDRATMDRIVNDDAISMKVGSYLIQPAPGLKYLLYNLLQISNNDAVAPTQIGRASKSKR